ncbi:M20 metallopeptidase family protein [Luteococcus sp. OSA5]|uniref:M20 metallopeptidase family protein n=1 Tax=Luteococcus sp. OSA5 TaxID=3401630 RepID=UPI003B4334BE
MWATLPTGTIDVKDGAASANSDLFTVTLRGQGVHASTPQDGVDPVIAASQFVSQAQTIVSRRVAPLSPAVLSTTWLEAGNQDALNVIPMTARLGGSIRSHDDQARETIRTGLHQIAAGLEASHPGLSVEVDHLQGYDMVWNDPTPTAVVRELAEQVSPGKVIADPPMRGGEDFAAFSQVTPSTYVFVGAAMPARASTPRTTPPPSAWTRTASPLPGSWRCRWCAPGNGCVAGSPERLGSPG